VTDLEWSGPEPDDRNLPPRKCRRHEWGDPEVVEHQNAGSGEMHDCRDPWFDCITVVRCRRCSHHRNEKAVRRGRTNRQRGNAIERAVGKDLGLRRVGQYGGPDDLSGLAFAAQVKSGGSFSERYWAWLKAVPVTANQTPILVVTDAPGPGHKRRAMVVLELSDWRALHGEDAA
jgi:hypothetical protein